MNLHDQSLGQVPLLPFYKRRNHGSEASECPNAIQLVAGARTRTRVCLIRSHVLPPVEEGTGWREGQRHGEEATAGGHGARGVALEVPPDPAALTGRGGGGEQASPSSLVPLRSAWGRSAQGSRKARSNSGYNSDK